MANHRRHRACPRPVAHSRHSGTVANQGLKVSSPASASAIFSGQGTADGTATVITGPDDVPQVSHDSGPSSQVKVQQSIPMDFAQVGGWSNTDPSQPSPDNNDDVVLSSNHLPRPGTNVGGNSTQPVRDHASRTTATHRVARNRQTGPGSQFHTLRSKLERALRLLDATEGEQDARLFQVQDQVNEASKQLALLRPDPLVATPAANAPTSPLRCLLCAKPREYRDRGTHKRHFRESHRIRYQYHCPHRNCSYFTVRRERLNVHTMNKHGQRLNSGAIDRVKEEFPCPSDCSTCSDHHATWEDMESCYIQFCLGGRRDSGGASIDWSHTEDQDSIIQDLDVNDLPPRPSRTVSHAVGPQNLSASFPGPTEVPARPPVLIHSSSDGVADMNRTRAESGHSLGDLLRDLPVGSMGLPPEQQPQEPEMDLSEPHCRQCRHPFRSCDSCFLTEDSTDYCHACPSTSPNGISQAQSLEPDNTIYLPGHGLPGVFNLPVDPSDATQHFFRDLVQRGNSYSYWIGTLRDASETYVHELGDPKIQESSPSALLPGLINKFGELSLSPTYENDNPKKKLPPTTVTKPRPDHKPPGSCDTATAGADLSSDRRVEMTVTTLPQDRASGSKSSSGCALKTRVRVVVKLLKLCSSVSEASGRQHAKAALQQAVEMTLGSSDETKYATCEGPPGSRNGAALSPASSPVASVTPSTSLSSSSSPIAQSKTPICPRALVYDKTKQPLAYDDDEDDDDDDEEKEEEDEEEEAEFFVELELNSSFYKLMDWTSKLAGDFCPFLSVPDAATEDDLTTDATTVLELFTIYLLYTIMFLARLRYFGFGPRLSQ
ncbi:uncharacterized protein N7459_000521 [Penicillium hispanicum]|uniref:uncharacterized protein n=1 Tax=Penicillium hispanicum TaxID=1080232 RepID=UPI002540924A|nr:uncharacterized protein N7459_000521 [Penicillium hispanicum]KAJ5594313.1 hypothetical protein N7459_000521 [Penicillium hispanicum]